MNPNPSSLVPCRLLAAASAGLLAQGASAAIYDDVTTDLSSNSASPTPLSFTTYGGVSGRLSDPDTIDALSLTDLLGGSTLNLSANWVDNASVNSFRIQFFNSSGGSLGVSDIAPIDGNGSDNRSITVPGNGIVRIVTGPGSGNLEGGNFTYNLDFSVEAVPEPATTAAGAAVGLAALLELRRRRAAK